MKHSLKETSIYQAIGKGIPEQAFGLPDNKIFKGENATKEESSYIHEGIDPYFVSDELSTAIHYASLLKRPLLLRGEPGTGKTRLAQAVAYSLYKANYRTKYFEWFVKSTTKVQDGLYKIDHLNRLYDTQKGGNNHIRHYRSFGPLGKAFLTSEPGEPSILLIDEIDKADLDFPNDLLLELDQLRFLIPETDEEIRAPESPIIIITSNDEKELPNAFLRRCIFHYIPFPEQIQLIAIVEAQAKKLEAIYKDALPDDYIIEIVKRFQKLQSDMKKNPNSVKIPATSELLDWLRIIHYEFFRGKGVKLEDIQKPDLLFPEVLLKSLDDHTTYTNKFMR